VEEKSVNEPLQKGEQFPLDVQGSGELKIVVRISIKTLWARGN